MRHGPYLEFREDGTPRGEGAYRHGKRHGTWTVRGRDGRIDPRFTQVFEDGRAVEE